MSRATGDTVASADIKAAPNSEPHEMRITDHGRIHSFVSFGLKFLQENPQRPLVLHTLPFVKDSPAVKINANAQSEATPIPESDTNTVEAQPDEEPDTKKRKIARPAANVPRLVSVVEIIKREYGKWAYMRQAPGGGPPDESLRQGLHQYNELETLEGLGIVQQLVHDQDDAETLRQALEGKNFLKQKFTPHLKVTLSVSAQPMLEAKGATHQPPLPIKKSKSARARERLRQKKKGGKEVIAV